MAILSELGGRSKTAAVYEYAVRANPKIQPELITNAVRGHLSRLYRQGRIGADKSQAKSEGYEYYVKDRQ